MARTQAEIDRDNYDYEQAFGTKANPVRAVPPPKSYKINLSGGKRLYASPNRAKNKVNFLIKKLHIVANEIIRFIGNPNSGKTYLALDLACRAILGLPFLGREEFIINFPPDKTVLFLQLEGGEQMTLLRLDRIVIGLCEHYRLNVQDTFDKINERLNFQFISAQKVAFSDMTQLESYQKEIAEQLQRDNVGLFVIDNQTALINTAPVNPNDAKARTILDCFKDAANIVSHDVYTIFIHHFNKSGNDAGTLQFKAAVGSEFNIEFDKKKHIRKIIHEKSNFQPSDDMNIEFISIGDHDPEIEATRGLLIMAKQNTIDPTIAEANELIINAIKSRNDDKQFDATLIDYNKGTLVALVVDATKDSSKLSKASVTKAVEALIANGELQEIEGANRAKLISLKPIIHGEVSF